MKTFSRLFVWLAIPLAFLCFGVLVATADESPARQELDAAPAGTVDTSAVLRSGDRVEHIAGAWEATREAVISQAIEQTPADDREKWFVSVVTLPGCPPCHALMEAWSKPPGVPEETLPMGSRKLRAIARPDPAEAKASWAHFNRYNAGDASQKAKFSKLKFAGFPAIVVQPPLSQKYGPSSHVVFQRSGFDGDADKLAEDILAAIRARVAKYAPEELEDKPAAKPEPIPLDLRPVRVPLKVGASGPVEGVNNLPPQPFKHDGTESVFPLFPSDEADDVPPRNVLDKYGRQAADWTAAALYAWLDEKVGGWLGWILSGLGVLFVLPRANTFAGWAWWALKLWLGLNGKPADPDAAPASGASVWARLQAALSAMLAELARTPETNAAATPTRKAASTRRKR